MIFRVLSEELALKYTDKTKHIFISICSPNEKHIDLPENANRLGVLNLRFHDLDQMPEGKGVVLGAKKPYKLFTKEMADIIWEFVDSHAGVETIICNCEAGISRSAGVIAGIKKGLGLSDANIFKMYLPNSLVYRTVVESKLAKR